METSPSPGDQLAGEIVDQLQIDRIARYREELSDIEVSEEALVLLDVLRNDLDRPEGGAIRHAIDTVKITAIFAKQVNGKIPPEVLEAALLHDLYGRMSKRDGYAEQLRGEYLKYCSNRDAKIDKIESTGERRLAYESLEKIKYILHNQVVLGVSARNFRKQAYEDMEASGDSDLSQRFSKKIPPLLGEEMRNILYSTFIESNVIKASEMLHKIRSPKLGKPSEEYKKALYDNIVEALSFYVPLLEAIRHEALASDLESACNIQGLRILGEGHFVDQAVELFREAEKADIGEIAKNMFGLSEKPDIKWIINESGADILKDTNCHFGEMKVMINGSPTRVKLRIKSIGSIARKLKEKSEEGKPDYSVMDLIGFYVLSGEEAHNIESKGEDLRVIIGNQTKTLAENFKTLASNLVSQAESNNFKWDSPGGHKSSIHIQGDRELCEALSRKNCDESYCDKVYNDMESEEWRNDRYPVAKITGRFKQSNLPGGDIDALGLTDLKSINEIRRAGIPVEIQVVRVYDHMLSKIGERNHSLYRSGLAEDVANVRKLVKFIKDMYNRRHFYGETGHNERSQDAGVLAMIALGIGIFPDYAKDGWNESFVRGALTGYTQEDMELKA